jgi:hypothetical protein
MCALIGIGVIAGSLALLILVCRWAQKDFWYDAEHDCWWQNKEDKVMKVYKKIKGEGGNR